MNIKELTSKIEELNSDIIEAQDNISSFDKSEHTSTEDYDDALDIDGTVTVAGYEYYPSNILQEVDPVAYNCGFSDYADSRELEEFEEYNELVEELEELESELEDKENELEELELEEEEKENV